MLWLQLIISAKEAGLVESSGHSGTPRIGAPPFKHTRPNTRECPDKRDSRKFLKYICGNIQIKTYSNITIHSDIRLIITHSNTNYNFTFDVILLARGDSQSVMISTD